MSLSKGSASLEKFNKNWRKRALKEMPAIASKVPKLDNTQVDLMKHSASFTLALGNEHVSQIELFMGKCALVRRPMLVDLHIFSFSTLFSGFYRIVKQEPTKICQGAVYADLSNL